MTTSVSPIRLVPIVSISISATLAILYWSITFERAKIASVIFSGAGPPLPILYLMPKSSFGPPGLWLAESIMPPKALYLRIMLDAAGVERMPP
ncbi:hypothetical protein D3C80_1982910 [compost metagenome]